MSDNSKEGKVPSTDGCPGLPVKGGRIFGNSPVRRAPIARHPTRSDSGGSDDPREQGNLRQASAPTPTAR